MYQNDQRRQVRREQGYRPNGRQDRRTVETQQSNRSQQFSSHPQWGGQQASGQPQYTWPSKVTDQRAVAQQETRGQWHGGQQPVAERSQAPQGGQPGTMQRRQAETQRVDQSQQRTEGVAFTSRQRSARGQPGHQSGTPQPSASQTAPQRQFQRGGSQGAQQAQASTSQLQQPARRGRASAGDQDSQPVQHRGAQQTTPRAGDGPTRSTTSRQGWGQGATQRGQGSQQPAVPAGQAAQQGRVQSSGGGGRGQFYTSGSQATREGSAQQSRVTGGDRRPRDRGTPSDESKIADDAGAVGDLTHNAADDDERDSDGSPEASADAGLTDEARSRGGVNSAQKQERDEQGRFVGTD